MSVHFKGILHLLYLPIILGTKDTDILLHAQQFRYFVKY